VVNNNKAVFLDRDGVINKPIIINKKPFSPRLLKDFIIIKNVKKSLEIISSKGYFLVVITNQPDANINQKIKKKIIKMNNLVKKKLKIDAIYTCFHLEKNNCRCRKPRIGNILKAQKKFKLDLKKCFFIGDRWKDMEAGETSNCKTVFINYNYNEKKPKKYYMKAKNLYEFTKKM
tara:strand:- start:5665 stop:6189 length:525 start_codon:yes stop_codon:yes gene_type:complete